MKAIIFKLIIVFLITVVIAGYIGNLVKRVSNNPEFVYKVNGVVQTNVEPERIGWKVGTTIFSILTLILLWFYITNIAILITSYKGTKVIKDENIIYQRDLADDYNSAVAGYIIDGTIDARQDYKAVLVELEERGLICIENGKYTPKNGVIRLKRRLLSNQEIVLNQIKEGRIDLNQFKKKVMQDAKELGYMKTNKSLFFALGILIFVFPLSIFLILYMIMKARPYFNILTEKGRKEKDKIIKLKNYLINYSNMNDLESSDNNIWGDYLAYAISLKVNKKLKVKLEEINKII